MYKTRFLNPGFQDARRNSSASLDGASSRLAQLHAHFTSAPGPSAQVVCLVRRFPILQNLVDFRQATFPNGGVVVNVAPLQNNTLLNGESRILEEDDLESVLSERDSFYQVSSRELRPVRTGE